ncbi:MAG: photosystem II stability/assembly factor-like uncharacterized protein, partial [Arenicella sp.]
LLPEDRTTISWNSHGPDNVGGRTRAILIDNSDYTHIYAGSVSGGLYESVDRANFWTPVVEFSDNLAVSSMCQTANGTIVVATGHQQEQSSGSQNAYDSGANGNGMYVMNSDGTFTQVAGTSTYSYINEVVSDTLDNIVWMATSSGLKKYDVVADAITDVTNGIPGTFDNQCTALSMSPDGEVIVAAMVGNRTYVSENGGVDFVDVSGTDATQIPQSFGRVEYAVSHEKDENGKYYVYASGSSSFLTGIFMSQNNGITWTQIAPANNQQPGSFSPFSTGGGSGQGLYDNIITAVKGNPKKLILGGIDTYSWATTGNWTQLSQWFLPPQASQYVHADNHEMKWDKYGRLYIGNDGGIQISDDEGASFFPANRGYDVTQFFAIGASAHGDVIGGAQDNGTQANYHDNSTWHEFDEVGGGDGFSCEISFINRNILLTSIYYGFTARSADRGENATAFFPDEFSTVAADNINCIPGSTGADINGIPLGCGQFFTNMKLWENPNDLASTDSISFVPQQEYAIGESIQIPSLTSQTFIDYSATFANTYDDTLDFNAGFTTEDTIVTSQAPSNDYNLTVFDYTLVAPAVHPLSAGDSIYLTDLDTTIVVSSTTEIDHYFGTNAGEPGEFVDMGNESQIYGVSWDTLLVQDPFQSWLAIGLGGSDGIWLTRNALRLSANSSEWFKVTDVPGTVASMEFSQDGQHLFIGTWGGSLYRLDGFGDVYSPAKEDDPLTGAFADTLIDMDQVIVQSNLVTSITNLGSFGAPVTGIAVEADPTHVVITLANYSGTGKVRESTDALGASASSFSASTGNLPSGLPCYSIVMVDPSTWVIGTDLGIYVTDDGGSTWANSSGGIGNTPVFDMKINWRTWDEGCFRPNEIYAGTHGKGIWSSADFLSLPSDQDNLATAKFIPNINVYPNPMTDQGNIGFSLETAGKVKVQIFNLSGQMVREINEGNLAEGNNNIQFNANDLAKGTYIIRLTAGDKVETSKFIKH